MVIFYVIIDNIFISIALFIIVVKLLKFSPLKPIIMIKNLLRKSWGGCGIAVLFATVVHAQDLATLDRNVNSNYQTDNSKQTITAIFQERKPGLNTN